MIKTDDSGGDHWWWGTDEPSMTTLTVENFDAFRTVKDFAVVHFFDSGKTGSKRFVPVYSAVRKSFSSRDDIAFGRVNCGEDQSTGSTSYTHPDLSGEFVCGWYKITGMPYIMLFRPGFKNPLTPNDMEVPVMTEDLIVKWLDQEIALVQSKRKTCINFKGCPQCTQNDCYWCSTLSVCHTADEAAADKCPLQKSRKECPDINLKPERASKGFIRPCERNLTIEGGNSCCGDAVCDSIALEDHKSCPLDCPPTVPDMNDQPLKLSQGVTSPIFGQLDEVVHDTYHCEDSYDMSGGDSICSHSPNRPSYWLESLLNRSRKETLPFAMPPPGAQVVELGCGLGQDTRNLATLADYVTLGIDVSYSAIRRAREHTEKGLLGASNGPGRVSFLAYDALALPSPNVRIDFLVDMTVYCGLRHRYLPRLYNLWRRLAVNFEPKTLVMIQCWQQESTRDGHAPAPVTVSREDMLHDFEPLFDVLLHEPCRKNQDLIFEGDGAWCFYMYMKSARALDEVPDAAEATGSARPNMGRRQIDF
jgi:SAM-dependent methyltransferase